MLELLYLQITIFLLVAVGFLLKRIGMVGDQGQKNINDLVIYVILPCNILKAFMVDFENKMAVEMVETLAISIGIQVLYMFYGRFFFGKKPDGKRQCLQYGTLCSNAGFLGNPVSEGVYGSYGLALASVFLIPIRVMMWSEGIAKFSRTKDMKSTLKKVCTHPCILACVLGLILLVTGFRFPEPITKTVTYIGNCNTAMSMMIIGMILEAIKPSEFLDTEVLIYSFHRLVLLPLLVLALVWFLPVGNIVKGLSVLLTAMPAGATTSILASKYEMEPEFATKMVITSTLLSLPSICLWSIFLTGTFPV